MHPFPCRPAQASVVASPGSGKDLMANAHTPKGPTGWKRLLSPMLPLPKAQRPSRAHPTFCDIHHTLPACPPQHPPGWNVDGKRSLLPTGRTTPFAQFKKRKAPLPQRGVRRGRYLARRHTNGYERTSIPPPFLVRPPKRPRGVVKGKSNLVSAQRAPPFCGVNPTPPPRPPQHGAAPIGENP